MESGPWGPQPSLPVKQVIRFPTRRRETSPSNDIGARGLGLVPRLRRSEHVRD